MAGSRMLPFVLLQTRLAAESTPAQQRVRERTCSIRNLIGLKDIAWEAVRNASVEGDCVQATWSDEGHIGEGNRR